MDEAHAPRGGPADPIRSRAKGPSALLVIAGVLALGFVGYRLVGLADRVDQRRKCEQCIGNLKQIGLALHSYSVDYDGYFPPAATLGPDGRAWHSWRALIVPYLEGEGGPHAYRLDQPWDGPDNRRLAGSPMSAFACPNHGEHLANGRTSYVAVVAAGAFFSGADRSCHIGAIADELRSTLMVVETAGVAIPWTEPGDLDAGEISPWINDLSGPGLSSLDPDGPHALFADGTARVLDRRLTSGRLRAWLSVAGGEVVDGGAD